MPGDIPFFLAWMKGIQMSDLPSTTRLVLFNLGMYMNPECSTCFPSIETQAEDTGLSKKAICDHIQKAVEKGWLLKFKKNPDSGKNWKRNAYRATFPEDFDRIESDSTRSVIGGEPNSNNCEPRSTDSLKEAQSNTNKNSSNNTNGGDGISEEKLRQMAKDCNEDFIFKGHKEKMRELGIDPNRK